jgi:hypothetical protein
VDAATSKDTLVVGCIDTVPKAEVRHDSPRPAVVQTVRTTNRLCYLGRPTFTATRRDSEERRPGGLLLVWAVLTVAVVVLALVLGSFVAVGIDPAGVLASLLGNSPVVVQSSRLLSRCSVLSLRPGLSLGDLRFPALGTGAMELGGAPMLHRLLPASDDVALAAACGEQTDQHDDDDRHDDDDHDGSCTH